MGHNSIQPWHYGFCDLSHAQSAVKESKKAAQAAHTTAAWPGGGGGAAAAFSLEEGSQGKQGMARQEKAWHGGQF